MKWTTEVPTVPGGYWWRRGRRWSEPEKAYVVNVIQCGPLLMVGSECPVEEYGGEWAGPIAAPEE